jgi:hypothetical protein
MKLSNNNEIVGTLTKIEQKNNNYFLEFNIKKNIEIPSSFFSKEKLNQLLGKKAGIININGEYKIREVRKGDIH